MSFGWRANRQLLQSCKGRRPAASRPVLIVSWSSSPQWAELPSPQVSGWRWYPGLVAWIATGFSEIQDDERKRTVIVI